MNDFSKNLIKYRSMENLSQRALAKGIECSLGAIQAWENGTSAPSANAIIAIAKFFNISTDELLGVESEENIAKLSNTVAEHYSDSEKRLVNLYRQIDAMGQQLIEDTAKTLARKQVKLVPIRTVARTADNSPSYEEIWVTEEEAAKLKERLRNAPKLDPHTYD